MIRTRTLLISIIASIAVVASCELVDTPDVGGLQAAQDAGVGDGSTAAPTGACGDSNPDVKVSFARDVRPLMTRMPGGCMCHLAITTSGFNLGTYENLRRGGLNSGTNVIVPGKPCDSIIARKISPTPPFGSRMPFNGPPHFTTAEQQIVRDWIAEGALNN